MTRAYYNEIDPVACAVLVELINCGVIADGVVDDRSISEVSPDDVRGFAQCHFFAGAGLWSIACRTADWADDRPVWTASCPCQGWSVAGKGLGFDDPRDLWPDLFRLCRAVRPDVVMGEITSGSAILPWFDRTCADLEGEDYACRAVSIPACAVDAPNIRQRLWWCAVANAHGQSRQQVSRSTSSDETAHGRAGRFECKQDSDYLFASSDENSLADPDSSGRDGRQEDAQRRSIGRDAAERADADLGDAGGAGLAQRPVETNERRALRNGGTPARSAITRSWWSDSEWVACADGKARRAQPGIRMLVDGMAGRADLWRLAGNSINPILASEVIKALKETIDAVPLEDGRAA